MEAITQPRKSYRVSHIEMGKVKWLRQMYRLTFLISNLWSPVQDFMTFGFYQPVFKKINISWLQQPPREKILDINENLDF